jgi:hypothetical protein
MTDPREILPNSRRGIRTPVRVVASSGRESHYITTFNLDEKTGRIIECFICHDESPEMKTGSELQALLEDGCKLLSRCLQYGDTIQDIATYCGENRPEGAATGPASSVIGAIARAGAEIERIGGGG